MNKAKLCTTRRVAHLLLLIALSALAMSCGIAMDDTYDTPVDTTLNVSAPGVLVNDFSTESEDLDAELVTGPSNAQSFVLNEDGSFSYTPNPGFTGEDTFTYEAEDSEGSLNEATVTIRVNANESIRIVKLTNGTDNNSAPGQEVPVGSTVTFTYTVTNPGIVPLTGITVVDDNGTPGSTADDFNPTFVGGDTNTNGILETTETWTYTANRIATPGQYTNIANASGTAPTTNVVNDADPDNHYGGDAGINIVKLTNGTDNNSPPGQAVPIGSTVTFTYLVTTSEVSFSAVTVTDDNGTPGNVGDNFTPAFVSGDTNTNSLLEAGETWTYTANRIATPGQHTNTAVVTGLPQDGPPPDSDSDVDNHFGGTPPSMTALVVVGSTGAVDDTNLAEYEVRNQFATIKDSVPVATVIYRYNLPAAEGFQNYSAGVGTYALRIRYRDTGDNQTVIVRLRAAKLGEDGVETIYSFNSDGMDSNGDAAPANSNQNQTFDTCFAPPGDHISHGTYAYFLEVEIQKRANDGTPSPGFIGFAISEAGISGAASCETW